MQLFWITMSKKRNETDYTLQNLRRKMFRPKPKCIPFPAPLSSPSLLKRGLPWRHRGPFPYWLPRWSQSDEESRGQMLPGLILLSPVSSVSTFTFVSLCSSPPRLICTALRFLSSGYSNSVQRSPILMYRQPKYMLLWDVLCISLYNRMQDKKKQWWVWCTLAEAQVWTQ